MHIPKDFRPLVKRLRAVGWGIERSCRGHYKITGGSKIVHVALTSGDPRARKNIEAELRRAGLEEAEGTLPKKESMAEEKRDKTAELIMFGRKLALLDLDLPPEQWQRIAEMIEEAQSLGLDPKELVRVIRTMH